MDSMTDAYMEQSGIGETPKLRRGRSTEINDDIGQDMQSSSFFLFWHKLLRICRPGECCQPLFGK
eukprot:5296780-Karenia_brevis.AAC.1